jgi:hypothetical protein
MTNGDVLKTSKLGKDDAEPEMEGVEAEGEHLESPTVVCVTPPETTSIADKRNF